MDKEEQKNEIIKLIDLKYEYLYQIENLQKKIFEVDKKLSSKKIT